jgi:hypothetical protein
LQYNSADGGGRWYDPVMSRWISQDPIGIDGGDYNFTRYVGNGPTNAIDPSGLVEFQWSESAERQYTAYGYPWNWTGWKGKPGPDAEPDPGNPELARAVGSALLGALIEPLDWINTAAEIWNNPFSRWSYAGLLPIVPAGAGKLGKGLAKAENAAECVQKAALSAKILRQMPTRGWTPALIDEAIAGGRQVPAINFATNNPATRYVHPITGQSVVLDNVTREVIHVGGPGFKYGPGSGDIP